MIQHTEGNEFIVDEKMGKAAGFFFLQAENAPGIWVGERRILMEGMVNFRDLGGYQTIHGSQIKWGLLFRGDSLQRATDSDLKVIRQLGIGVVYDFRRTEEVAKGPDRFPVGSSIIYHHVPVIHGEFNFVAALERLKEDETETIGKETIIKGYIDNATNFAWTWGKVISRLAEKECPPLLFHCTAGKDRTGICAALILSALEVPREIVIEDYLLSNPYIADVWKKVEKMIAAQGVNPERLIPFFNAPQYAIDELLDHLDRKYGSILEFLIQKAGVTQKTINALKKRLLESI